MDGLREGIGLRGYAQKDPKVEFQREGFQLFAEMEERIDVQATQIAFRFVLQEPRVESAPALSGLGGDASKPGSAIARQSGGAASRGTKKSGLVGARDANEKVGKIGRNDPCPCGSGKKYKKCCGA